MDLEKRYKEKKTLKSKEWRMKGLKIKKKMGKEERWKWKIKFVG